MFHWDDRALDVLNRLTAAGHRAVLVGGCVRDSLLGIPPHDYDAATSALPDEIRAACAGLTCLDIGLKHGTITVLSGGIPVEVTTFRKETTYSDHRHPDAVEFTNDLTEDLARRDFTVNAMAWESAGLMDPFGGQQDLEQKLIRCVGDPDRRFEEDALRILRGLRLAAQQELISLHRPYLAAASGINRNPQKRLAALPNIKHHNGISRDGRPICPNTVFPLQRKLIVPAIHCIVAGLHHCSSQSVFTIAIPFNNLTCIALLLPQHRARYFC